MGGNTTLEDVAKKRSLDIATFSHLTRRGVDITCGEAVISQCVGHRGVGMYVALDRSFGEHKSNNHQAPFLDFVQLKNGTLAVWHNNITGLL